MVVKIVVTLLSLLPVTNCLSMVQDQPIAVENKWLRVNVYAKAGTFTITDKASNRVFVSQGKWNGGGGQAGLLNRGVGDIGITIRLIRENGDSEYITLPDNLSFALLSTTYHNRGVSDRLEKKPRIASFELDLGEPSKLKAQGTGGLTSLDKAQGSYCYLAIAEPMSRNGVVFGWLTHERGDGVFLPSVFDGRVNVEGQIDYGNLRVAPGKDEPSEVLMVGYFDDARIGLEAYADAIAKFYQVKLKAQPAGYCTWYADKYGKACDEQHLQELTEFAKKNLGPFGFSFVQIDDMWQIGKRREGPSKNFTGAAPEGPYPGGMKKAADGIKSLGFIPGIWFIPFAADHQDPLFASHPDWFVKTADGKPWETKWGGTSLDLTNPDVRDFIKTEVQRIANEWGYDYFKMDGLYTGTATKQVYVNDGYENKGPDQIGEAVFHDPNVTNIQAYRSGLKLIREAVGPDVFFLGCNVSQNMRTMGGSFGLLDAMRIGPDNGAAWERLTRGPEHGSRKYFLHGRVWYNDPDPVYVRDSMPLNHARLIASWVSISGQLFTDSDWLPDASQERLDILKRTMAPHRLLPRPVDFFESSIPRIWLLSNKPGGVEHHIVALYNWDSKDADISCSIEHLGLDPTKSYVAFDYWDNKLVPVFKDQLSATLPGQSCKILAVHAVSDSPQVISTSRHVTQGIVDRLEQKWDAASNSLSGVGDVIANDPYELRVVSPKGLAVDKTNVEGDAKVISSQNEDQLLRVRIESPRNERVKWTISWKRV
jgi:hypothetical protein